MAPGHAILYRWFLGLCIIGATAISTIDTVPHPWGAAKPWVVLAAQATLTVMFIDYLLRLRLAWHGNGEVGGGWRGLRRYALGVYGVFDFLAAVPFMVGPVTGGLPLDAATMFGVLRFLKLARYSPALETLGTVLLSELKPLVAALFIIILLAVTSATALYFAERGVNPNIRTVPQALWWAIITLTTVGYGDVVPVTVLGKLINAVVAVLGLCMFALPASILATGFAEEMRRRDFVSNWHLVAKVPFFDRLHAGQIAQIAALLKPYRATRGEVLVREGDMGDSMYFIVSGQVEGRNRNGRFVLRAGEFFGEIALVESCRRTATIAALTRSQLLVLDARDFQKFVSGYPDLMMAIWETARQRLAQNQSDKEAKAPEMAPS